MPTSSPRRGAVCLRACAGGRLSTLEFQSQAKLIGRMGLRDDWAPFPLGFQERLKARESKARTQGLKAE